MDLTPQTEADSITLKLPKYVALQQSSTKY